MVKLLPKQKEGPRKCLNHFGGQQQKVLTNTWLCPLKTGKKPKPVNTFRFHRERKERAMKTTMKRRIDDLGRVLIPNKIRRLLLLKEDDKVEFVLENGRVYIRKHSYLTDLNSYLQDLADTIHEVCGHIVIITDEDKIISVAGEIPIMHYLEQPITANIKRAFRTTLMTQLYDETLTDDQRFKFMLVVPIYRYEKPVGAIIIASQKDMIAAEDITMIKETARQASKQLS